MYFLDVKILARNRKAFHDYDVIDKLEAGIVLAGTEVKTLRTGKANFADSYASVEKGEIFLYSLDIPLYEQGNRFNHEAKRKRKLLLHAKEIERLSGQTEQKGLTIVPLSIYLNDKSKVKVELGICKGRKLHDKRAALAAKEAKRAIREFI
ncbi:MAG: SsrA-binding protein SmpB [Fibrobacteres bacterium]|nr:SsrA-binding protein SmpB [Fibrobacterota bacterium]